MNPKQTALVLIEYQNDFTSDGGSLHEAEASPASRWAAF
jgi:ureidoacrylate peracid hydrolase